MQMRFSDDSGYDVPNAIPGKDFNWTDEWNRYFDGLLMAVDTASMIVTEGRDWFETCPTDEAQKADSASDRELVMVFLKDFDHIPKGDIAKIAECAAEWLAKCGIARKITEEEAEEILKAVENKSRAESEKQERERCLNERVTKGLERLSIGLLLSAPRPSERAAA